MYKELNEKDHLRPLNNPHIILPPFKYYKEGVDSHLQEIGNATTQV